MEHVLATQALEVGRLYCVFKAKKKLFLAVKTILPIIAAIQALLALTESCHVSLTTDSQYVRQGITSWIHNWQKHGWRTASNDPVKNVDLWKQLIEHSNKHQIKWHWVKGHSGHRENDLVDQAAREAVIKIKQS